MQRGVAIFNKHPMSWKMSGPNHWKSAKKTAVFPKISYTWIIWKSLRIKMSFLKKKKEELIMRVLMFSFL